MLTYQGYGGVDGVVAGSKHVFTLQTSRGVEKLLHDCGNQMGEIGVNRQFNQWQELVRGLTVFSAGHGHFDHVGDVAKLYAQGYAGPFYGHPATLDLTKSHLSGQVNQAWIEVKGKKDARGEWLKPNFTSTDLKNIVRRFMPVDYGRTVQISPNIRATYFDAGHIIGSSQVRYDFKDEKGLVSVHMAVDLGRSDIDAPILNFPCTSFPNPADICFIEATYGDRAHTDRNQTRRDLKQALDKIVAENRRGLMGTFAIGRSHWVLDDLFELYLRGEINPNLKIYVDSPSIVDGEKIILKHRECLDPRALQLFDPSHAENPFKFRNLVYPKNKQESQALDQMKGPYLIISASGMWFMGRVKDHLKVHIEDPSAMLIQTGYQVPGCIGHLLEQGKQTNPTIRIDGQAYNYRAEQVRLRGYSAHADGNGCVKHVTEFVKPRRGTFVVHGEREQSEWTKQQLEARGQKAEIVRLGHAYDISAR